KVQAIQPTASVAGPAVGVPGQPLAFTLGASESGLAPDTLHTFQVLWGDGSPVPSFSGASGTQMTHAFRIPGHIVINVTATDPSGNTSLVASTSLSITPIAMDTDPYNSSLTALYMGGTSGNDNIAITPVAGNGVKVGMNSASLGTFFPTGHVIVYGLA